MAPSKGQDGSLNGLIMIKMKSYATTFTAMCSDVLDSALCLPLYIYSIKTPVISFDRKMFIPPIQFQRLILYNQCHGTLKLFLQLVQSFPYFPLICHSTVFEI